MMHVKRIAILTLGYVALLSAGLFMVDSLIRPRA